MITAEGLHAICPQTPFDRLVLFVEPLNLTIEEFEVGRVAEFIAQWAHETQGFSKLEENLNYTAGRLPQVWKRFAENPEDPPLQRRPNALAVKLAHNPQALANYIYAGRIGNGSEVTGDGWRFRGRGLPHLTFRSNYANAGIALGLPLLSNPDLLLEPLHAARAGGWFWKANGCELITDWALLTQKINGSPATAPQRLTYLDRTQAVFA